MKLTKANNKQDLVDETVFDVKKAFNLNVSTDLVNKIVNTRSESIRKGIEHKIPRIIIGGLGSFKIKQGKKQKHGIKLSREDYVRAAGEGTLKNLSIRFATMFKIVSDNEN